MSRGEAHDWALALSTLPVGSGSGSVVAGLVLKIEVGRSKMIDVLPAASVSAMTIR